jgi:hypothetical protein
MGRFAQPLGERGSLKWIQETINQSPPRKLDQLILAQLKGAQSISWMSPLSSDDHAEYRDSAFLEKIGAGALESDLKAFWPDRGPQWDALGRSNRGDVLLVEAKAHVAEVCSPPCGAGEESRKRIEAALEETAAHLDAKPRVEWSHVFYQLANRLAHLYFLRKHDVEAWLVLVSFIEDAEMKGPSTQKEWEAAYQVVWHVLGIEDRHALSKYIIHVYPSTITGVASSGTPISIDEAVSACKAAGNSMVPGKQPVLTALKREASLVGLAYLNYIYQNDIANRHFCEAMLLMHAQARGAANPLVALFSAERAVETMKALADVQLVFDYAIARSDPPKAKLEASLATLRKIID